MSDPLQQLAQALFPLLEQQKGRQFGIAQKHDITGTPGNVYSHGPGGMLTWPGVDPAMFSAMLGNFSILDNMPAVPSLNTNPTYYTLTGVRDVTGDEADGVCDNAPVAGLAKACLTTSVFGRYDRATPLLDVSRLGARVDRADPLDLRLLNTPMMQMGPFAGASNVSAPRDLFTNEVSRKFWERNVAFHRLLSQQVWSGTPANNGANGGYRELTGLETLVNTGYVDAETGTACAAMDSYLRDFGHARIDSAAGATRIVAELTNMYYQLKQRALRAGVSPVRLVMAMRPQLFYELTAVWPCSYLTFRCLNSSDASPNNIDAQDAVRFRDEMRAGRYLLIDGDRVEVLVDDGITEDDGNSSGGNFPAGCFETDIFFLPMSVVGGQSTLYLEYFQYQNPSIQDALGNMVLGRIDGAFLTWPRQTNMCIQWQSRIEPRLVLRTPWLGGRLSNVVYCPIEHEREPFPTDPYFVNGGASTRSGPSYYSLWQS